MIPCRQFFVCRGDFNQSYFAGVSEWQTRQTQNLLSERACGFESHRRHCYSCGFDSFYIKLSMPRLFSCAVFSFEL